MSYLQEDGIINGKTMEIIEKDRFFIKRALRLAAIADGKTSPNPMVGAIIVKNGRVVAEDFHKKAGEPHAEALVIERSKEKARGSTLYVTLEPCCHLDKRTPPCTKAIIDAGIKRVVIAMRDPNPKVSGGGISELRRHGIEVIEGVCEEEAKRLNEAYIKYITTGMPFVILKAAMTLDGKIATPEGESKWITGVKARKLVHKMRSNVDAILTAVGTVKTDNPELTVRVRKRDVKQPKRIIIDPILDIPINYKIFETPPETIVVTKKEKKEDIKQNQKDLINKGIKIIEYEGDRLDLRWLMKRLGEMGIMSVMIEGGASLNAYALEDGIVDKVVFFIAPKIIGGRDSIPVVGGNFYKKLEDAYRIKDINIRKVAEDIMITGYLMN